LRSSGAYFTIFPQVAPGARHGNDIYFSIAIFRHIIYRMRESAGIAKPGVKEAF